MTTQQRISIQKRGIIMDEWFEETEEDLSPTEIQQEDAQKSDEVTDLPDVKISTSQREHPFCKILGGKWTNDRVGQTFITNIDKPKVTKKDS